VSRACLRFRSTRFSISPQWRIVGADSADHMAAATGRGILRQPHR
jgi:hypothetical protein